MKTTLTAGRLGTAQPQANLATSTTTHNLCTHDQQTGGPVTAYRAILAFLSVHDWRYVTDITQRCSSRARNLANDALRTHFQPNKYDKCQQIFTA